MYRLYLRIGIAANSGEWNSEPSFVALDLVGGAAESVTAADDFTGGPRAPVVVFDPGAGVNRTVIQGAGASLREWFSFEKDMDAAEPPTYAIARFYLGYWESLNVRIEASVDGVSYIEVASGGISDVSDSFDPLHLVIHDWPPIPVPGDAFWTGRILTTEYAR